MLKLTVSRLVNLRGNSVIAGAHNLLNNSTLLDREIIKYTKGLYTKRATLPVVMQRNILRYLQIINRRRCRRCTPYVTLFYKWLASGSVMKRSIYLNKYFYYISHICI